jgi:nicotinamide-nucleotide adenylyltransferase
MQKALGPFFGRAKLRVTMRMGDEWGGADEQTAYLADLLQGDGRSKVGGNKDWGRRVEMIEGREVGADIISSTYARVAAKDRDSDRLNLTVTPGVRWWIEQEGLYTE